MGTSCNTSLIKQGGRNSLGSLVTWSVMLILVTIICRTSCTTSFVESRCYGKIVPNFVYLLRQLTSNDSNAFAWRRGSPFHMPELSFSAGSQYQYDSSACRIMLDISNMEAVLHMLVMQSNAKSVSRAKQWFASFQS